MIKKKTGLVAAAMMLVCSTAAAQTPIKFDNDWKWEGPAAPLLLAWDRGYYADEGLDVQMDTGKGSLDVIPRVASGTYKMGNADINSLIKFRDKNLDLPVKAIFMLYNAPPFAIVGRKSLGVNSPKDLEGKILGAPAPDGAYVQWNAFVKENGIDASAVTIENVSFPVREPMLAQGKVDAITGYAFSSFINLKAQGVEESDISVLLMRDHGLDLYATLFWSIHSLPLKIQKQSEDSFAQPSRVFRQLWQIHLMRCAMCSTTMMLPAKVLSLSG